MFIIVRETSHDVHGRTTWCAGGVWAEQPFIDAGQVHPMEFIDRETAEGTRALLKNLGAKVVEV